MLPEMSCFVSKQNLVDLNDSKLLLALKRSNNLISKLNHHGEFLYVSSLMRNLLGYSDHELYNFSIFSLSHPSDYPRLKELLSQQQSNSNDCSHYRLRRKDGEYIWIKTTFLWMYDDNEFLCISHDITKQIQNEEKLLEEKEKYWMLVEQSNDTMGIITECGVWTYINKQGKRFLGSANNKNIVGSSLFDYIPPACHKHLSNYLKENKPTTFEMNVKGSDNILSKVEILLTPTYFKYQKEFQIIMKDITGQKNTEEQLHNAEKLSTIGQIAAGIVHEIRNPLTAIKGFAQLILEDQTNERAEVILSELNRIESIVNDLLILAKPQPQQMVKMNILSIIKNVVVLMKIHATLSNITINEDYDSSEVIVCCEMGKIKQLLINIIKNSIEAMPKGGTITICTRKLDNFFELHISDEGVGIDDERLSRMGEPFFSTKEKGTGLGLTICNKIVKNHDGNLTICSKKNEGTTVTIQFPLVR